MEITNTMKISITSAIEVYDYECMKLLMKMPITKKTYHVNKQK